MRQNRREATFHRLIPLPCVAGPRRLEVLAKSLRRPYAGRIPVTSARMSIESDGFTQHEKAFAASQLGEAESPSVREPAEPLEKGSQSEAKPESPALVEAMTAAQEVIDATRVTQAELIGRIEEFQKAKGLKLWKANESGLGALHGMSAMGLEADCASESLKIVGLSEAEEDLRRVVRHLQSKGLGEEAIIAKVFDFMEHLTSLQARAEVYVAGIHWKRVPRFGLP